MDERTPRIRARSLGLGSPAHSSTGQPPGSIPRGPSTIHPQNTSALGGEVAVTPDPSDATPRFSRQEKGKNRMVYSDDEHETDETMGEIPTPQPFQSRETQNPQESPHSDPFPQHRYVTQDDITRICQSFHDLTRDIIRELVSELRTSSNRSESRHYAADDEAEHDTPRRRLVRPRAKYPGVKRRPPAENTLSVVVFPLTLFSLLKSLSETRKGAHGEVDPRGRSATRCYTPR